VGVKEQIDEIYWLGTTITDTLMLQAVTPQICSSKYFFQMQTMYPNYLKNQFSRKDKKWTGVVYYQDGEKAVQLVKGDISNAKHFTYLYLTRAAHSNA
jgi:hypothetical protein